ncbi:CDP-glycerol glycerophosphotransferase family protein [Microbacterium sp. H37-C3]|uniref:CDP-glycerol glycerophosphotransferase family protein n=1 Tax=Microbacterium sp. H37-C3 TaxID=3004354 RepID=UPI0022AE697D|nr:CDP-glycerol glycerophosphotransferase family protein [Microbacterium sp. H37-C3]MCZ4066652.1 CDP-glycerol glycerophosphotransferase family protein [Microbacterium sp. H37-C3]
MMRIGFDVEGSLVLTVSGAGPAPGEVQVVGPRARSRAEVTTVAGGWTARVPLHASRWGGASLPLPGGSYDLVIDGVRMQGDGGQDTEMPAPFHGSTLRASWDGALLRIGPPVDPALASGEGSRALEQRYAAHRGPLENAVFFESFYGRSASDNPLAIDRELARVAPAVTRYWSVVDLSVAVPEGAIAVVDGSPEWWRARGAARLLVVNDWLRRQFVRKPGQVVLQTWHGTPLKRLALHRPGFDPRRVLAVFRESRRWDILLAQNPYSARVLRAAYAFRRKPVWVEGYPRTDELHTGDREAVRASLGIDAGEQVLLYAPTWRDDRETIVDFLDLPALAEATGAVVLVRGHSRTLAPGADERGARVIDVTSYPDLAALQLASDALITDYSSVMFDYSVTGRPMYFFVPDLEHYRGELRGFYFDLTDAAPGPVVRTQKELVRAITSGEGGDPERYARWRARFNARDDSRAAERVVARILDQGLVSRD